MLADHLHYLAYGACAIIVLIVAPYIIRERLQARRNRPTRASSSSSLTPDGNRFLSLVEILDGPANEFPEVPEDILKLRPAALEAE